MSDVVKFRTPKTMQKERMLELIARATELVESGDVEQLAIVVIHQGGGFGTIKYTDMLDIRMTGALEILKSEIIYDMLEMEAELQS